MANNASNLNQQEADFNRRVDTLASAIERLINGFGRLAELFRQDLDKIRKSQAEMAEKMNQLTKLEGKMGTVEKNLMSIPMLGQKVINIDDARKARKGMEEILGGAATENLKTSEVKVNQGFKPKM